DAFEHLSPSRTVKEGRLLTPEHERIPPLRDLRLARPPAHAHRARCTRSNVRFCGVSHDCRRQEHLVDAAPIEVSQQTFQPVAHAMQVQVMTESRLHIDSVDTWLRRI